MTLQDTVMLVLRTSIMTTTFCVGLEATLADVTYLFRQPSKLVRSLTAMDIAMPAFALAAVALFTLHPAVEIALVALSVSPIPPLFPRRAAGGAAEHNYIISLLITAGFGAIVVVPLGIHLCGWLLGVPLTMPVSKVLAIIGLTVIVPLLVGIAFRAVLPDLSARIAKPLGTIALVMLVLGALPLVVTTWKPMLSLIGNGTVLILAAFFVFGLTVGHLLGGPEHDDRTALAFATASRHPAMALAIATANFPAQKLAAPAIVLYLLVGLITCIPYTIWRKRTHDAES